MHDKESGTYLDDLGYRPNPTAAIINNKINICLREGRKRAIHLCLRKIHHKMKKRIGRISNSTSFNNQWKRFQGENGRNGRYSEW